MIEPLESRTLLSNYVVTSAADSTSISGTLRDAINAANSAGGDSVITFDLPGSSTISLSSTGDDTFGQSAFAVSGDITIDGSGAPGLVLTRDTTDTPGNLRAFYVTSSGSLTLENLTLSGFLAKGGDGGAGGGGAGLGGSIVNAGTLTLDGVTMDGNLAQGGSTSSISEYGGGGLNGTAPGNSGGGPNGGAYDNPDGGDGGFGGGGGGGEGDEWFDDGDEGGFGGGGGSEPGSIGGQGGFGGGGGSYNGVGGFGGGASSSDGVNGSGGGGAGLGGAIFNYGGTIDIVNSTFADNTAQGGLQSGSASGDGYGGAIFNLDGSVTATDTTIAYNTADAGGAIYSLGDDSVATQSGPTLPSATATVTLNDSILADSSNGVSDYVQNAIDSGAVASSGEYDIIQTSDSSGDFAGSATSEDPMLDSSGLSLNGGPTQTIALQKNSPALGAGGTALAMYDGTVVSADQTGVSRVDPEEIGAFYLPGATIDQNTANLSNTSPTITITGSNFDPTAADDSVMFSSGAVGTVTSASSDSITVTFSTEPAVGELDAVVSEWGVTSGTPVEVANVVAFPTLDPASVSSVNYTHALASGNVTSAGTDAITARGFLYAPTSADADLSLGSTGVTEVDDATASAGAFDDELTGLSSLTQYSLVAFATSDAGTSYSPITTFTTTSIVVNTLSDPGGSDGQTSLRQAIAIADADGGNQTITFDPSLTANGPATITLDGSDLSLDDTSGTLTIQGPGADLLSINANKESQVFNLSSGSSATLDGLTITGGNGDDGGGGISADSSTTLNVNDCVVSDNSAEVGGGINSEGSAVTINNTTFSGNTSQDFGAGLAAGCTDATVEGCTFSGNTSNTSSSPMGAAVWASCTNLLISDSCIEQNVGYYQGGIYLQGTTITIDNSTIADNTATADVGNASAGVLDEFGQGNIDIINSTIAGNTNSGFFPTGLETLGGSVTLDNTILADQSEITLSNDSSNNLFGPDAVETWQVSGTDLVAPSIAAMGLGTLGNYGAATQTIPLLPGSPAIDAGSNTLAVDASGDPLTADQRGSNRIVNGTVDIGAYESHGFTIAVSGGNNQTADVGSAFATPLAVQVTANDADLTDLTGGMITLSAPSSGASAELGSNTIRLDSDGDASVDATANQTAGTYDVTAAASGISIPADFTLTNQYVAPTVTLEPASQTVDATKGPTFTAAASGDPAPTVQWQVSSDGGTNYTDIPNATSTTLQVIASRSLDGNLYRAVFTNDGGSATSDAAMLNVNGLGTSIVLSNLGGAYTGLPRPVTVQVSGVDAPAADSIEGVTPTVTYYQGQNQTGAASSTPPVNPGDYSVFVQFPGSDDYAPSSAAVNFSISKASPVLNVASASVVYDGHSHAASGSAQGVGSGPTNLTSLLHLSYRNATTGVDSSKAPTLPGTYEILATFYGNADYAAYSNLNTGKTLTITPFQQVTKSCIITQGTTAALSGRIAFAGAAPSGSVKISIHGVTRSASIARNGDFAIAFPVGTLRTGTYSIEYAFTSPSDGVRMTDEGTLQVGYDVVPTYNVKHSYPTNSHIKLSFELESAAGKRITSGPLVRASGIASAATPSDPRALPSGSSANGTFTADDQTGTYSMNLSTAGLAPGRYVIDLAIQGDPTSHSLAVVIA